MLELVERQSALAGARLVAVDLVDHLADLVLRDLEAAHVQRLLQLRQLDVARSIAVNLPNQSQKQALFHSSQHCARMRLVSND